MFVQEEAGQATPTSSWSAKVTHSNVSHIVLYVLIKPLGAISAVYSPRPLVLQDIQIYSKMCVRCICS